LATKQSGEVMYTSSSTHLASSYTTDKVLCAGFGLDLGLNQLVTSSRPDRGIGRKLGQVMLDVGVLSWAYFVLFEDHSTTKVLYSQH